MFRRSRPGTRLDILHIPDELTRFEHYWFIRDHLATNQIQAVSLELSDDLSNGDLLLLDRALRLPLGHTQVTQKHGNTQRVTSYLAAVHHCLAHDAALYKLHHRRAGLFDRWRRLAYVQRARPKSQDNRRTARFLRHRLRGNLWNAYMMRFDRIAHIKVPRMGEPPRFRLEAIVSKAAERVNLVEVHTGTIESVHLLLGLPPLEM